MILGLIAAFYLAIRENISLQKKNEEMKAENEKLKKEIKWKNEKEKIKTEVFGNAKKQKEKLATGSAADKFNAAVDVMREQPKN